MIGFFDLWPGYDCFWTLACFFLIGVGENVIYSDEKSNSDEEERGLRLNNEYLKRGAGGHIGELVLFIPDSNSTLIPLKNDFIILLN